MKTRLAITAMFASALLSATIKAQVMLEGRNMMTISIEEAMKPELLQDHRNELVDAAFQTKRIDLLQLCWKTEYLFARYMTTLKDMPDSAFKDQIFLMMLRTESPGTWCDTPGLEDYKPSWQYNVARQVIPLLKHRLPDLPVEFATISTPERRLKIAEDYEKAMAAAGVPSVGAAPPPRVAEKASPETTAKPQVPVSAPTTPHSPSSPKASSDRVPWLAVVVFAALGGLVWLVRRK